MEPAPEERDDLTEWMELYRLEAAAMEPAPEERDDARARTDTISAFRAAMEPAPEERDDRRATRRASPFRQEGRNGARS